MTDLPKLRVLDLFSGIGGFSLGLERTGGFETVAFCEIDPYAQKVLRKHWPEVPIYDDVRELTGDRLAADGICVDVICGGFPCQDISVAGHGEGIEGERSGLWREYARLIRETRPRVIIVENVRALLVRGMERVLGDLADIGYDAEWGIIPASAVGAPHRRDRIWIAAYPSSERGARLVESIDTRALGPWGVRCSADMFAGNPFERGDCWPQPLLRRVDDGLSGRVDRLRGTGNAVVPEIPRRIGNEILRSIGR